METKENNPPKKAKPKEWPKDFFEKIHIKDKNFKRPPQGKSPPTASW